MSEQRPPITPKEPKSYHGGNLVNPNIRPMTDVLRTKKLPLPDLTKLETLRTLLLIAFLVIMAILLAHAMFNPVQAVCPREHNGYPLVNFELGYRGETDCQYGTQAIQR